MQSPPPPELSGADTSGDLEAPSPPRPMRDLASRVRRRGAALWRSWSGDRPEYVLTRDVYLRLLGVVYGIAFISLWTQIHGLVGSTGILPVADYLDAVREQLGSAAYWRLPTLCWISSSDGFLTALCAAGTVLSVLLIARIAPLIVLFLLWATYLSLSIAGQVFLSFQWDVLLLEAGFLAMFLAPLRPWSRPARDRPPWACGIWLQRWLLFKLMFLSGVTKLLWGDVTWRDLTALDYHYETQPIPTWVSWYVHQLPAWMQKVSVVNMFAIECIVPFAIFAPRRIRHLAAAALAIFQLAIAATGNYCFFNLLSLVLCVTLLDDRLLSRMLPRRWRQRLDGSPTSGVDLRWMRSAALTAALIVTLISGLSLVDEMVRTPRRDRLPAVVVGTLKVAYRGLLSWGRPLLLRPTDPFRTINGYGLFRVMTTQRPEIVIEGSNDGALWKPYEFAWKPGDVERRPGFVAPHQPRLDWQMWFAALNPRGASWLNGLIQRLLEGSPEVLNLLAEEGNPFPPPGKPPRYIRLLYYRYTFTDFEQRRSTGAWWERRRMTILTPPISLPEKQEERD